MRRCVCAFLVATVFAFRLTAQTVITEPTWGIRVNGGGEEEFAAGLPNRYIGMASVGYLKQVGGVQLGGLLSAGTFGDFFVGVGARLRVKPSKDVLVDLTPTYMMHRSGQPGNQRLLLDAGVMYRDRVGIGVQAFSSRVQFFPNPYPEPPFVDDRTTVFAGLRLGSKPGRYGIIADLAALLGTALTIIIVCAGGNCD